VKVWNLEGECSQVIVDLSGQLSEYSGGGGISALTITSKDEIVAEFSSGEVVICNLDGEHLIHHQDLPYIGIRSLAITSDNFIVASTKRNILVFNNCEDYAALKGISRISV
jgi:hypothetical protein